jgi:four helix bundle protein
LDEQGFKKRTQQMALRVIRLVEALPSTPAGWVMGKQLLRCATSVGANYRSACRAKSAAAMIAKLGIVEEEADECLYWLELLMQSNLIPAEKVQSLFTEINEILSMTVASIKTLRTKSNPAKSNPKSKI